MRNRLSRGAVLATALFIVAALPAGRPAVAETTGAFTFTPPAGWSPCKGIDGFQASFCNPKGALIAVASPIQGADAATLARGWLKGAEILRDQAIPFAGQDGHMIVARITKGGQPVLIAVSVTVAQGGAAVALIASKETVDEAIAAYVAVIDGGSFGGAGGAAPAAGARRKFTITNVSAGCDTTVTIDGQAVTVPSGKTVEVQLPEGKHEFEWTEPDGSRHTGVAGVPPAESLSAGCVAQGGTPPPTRPATPAPAGDMFDGARSMVSFYRVAWNIVLGEQVLDPNPKSMDRLMLRVIAGRPADRRKDLTRYSGYLAELDGAAQRTAQDKGKRAELRRFAFLILNSAGQIGVPDACVPRERTREALVKAIDCSMDQFIAEANKDPLMLWAQMGERFDRAAAADDPAEFMGEVQKIGR